MRNAIAIASFVFAACMSCGAQAWASDITGPLRGVTSSLAALVAGGTVTTPAFFAAVMPLGFAERASYDVKLTPRVLPHAASLPPARLLPFGMVLDAVLGKASVQMLDGIADAQGDNERSAVYFEQGPIFLADIKAALTALGLPSETSGATTRLTLTRPLVLSSRATLVLLPGEELTLDRAKGAFLIAAGGLIVDRAAIVASNAPNVGETSFRPFILADATTGPVELSGARFEGLGFGHDPRSAGLSLTGGSSEPSHRSFIQDTSFQAMGSVSLVDASNSTIRRNVFKQSFNTALAIVSSTSIIVDGNAVMAANPGHGVKVGPNATDILVSDNVIVGNDKHGLLFEGNTAGSTIFNNLLLENHASGVAVLDGSCLSLEQNLALGNAADGIMLRNSAQLRLETNVIAGNRRAGVSISGDNGTVQLQDNRFDANKIGLRASASFDLALNDNDWTGQVPRLLDGDIAQYTIPLLAGIKSGDTHLAMAGLPLSAARTAALGACKPGEAI